MQGGCTETIRQRGRAVEDAIGVSSAHERERGRHGRNGIESRRCRRFFFSFYCGVDLRSFNTWWSESCCHRHYRRNCTFRTWIPRPVRSVLSVLAHWELYQDHRTTNRHSPPNHIVSFTNAYRRIADCDERRWTRAAKTSERALVPETEIDSAPTSKIVCSRELEERVIFRIVSAFTALFRMNLLTYAISLLDNSLSLVYRFYELFDFFTLREERTTTGRFV